MRSHTQTQLDMDNMVDGTVFPLVGERVRASSFVRYIFCLTFCWSQPIHSDAIG